MKKDKKKKKVKVVKCSAKTKTVKPKTGSLEAQDGLRLT